MGAKPGFGKADSRHKVFKTLIFKGVQANFPANPLIEGLLFSVAGTGIIRHVVQVAVHGHNGPPSNEVHGGLGRGKIQEIARENQAGASQAHMNLPGSRLKNALDGSLELGSPHHGVITKQGRMPANEIGDRDEFHLGHQIPDFLILGHEGPGPGGRIFYKRPLIGNAFFIGVAQGVPNAGIRDARHIIGLHIIIGGEGQHRIYSEPPPR